MHTGVIVLAIVLTIVLFIVMVLAFVTMSKLDKTRFQKLWNWTVGAAVAALIVFFFGIVAVIALSVKKVVEFGTLSVVFSLIFGVVLVIVGAVMAAVTFMLVTDPGYNPIDANDVSAFKFALITSGFALFASALILLAGIFMAMQAAGICSFVEITEKIKTKLP